MVDCSGLENRRRGNPTGGSNPSLSASPQLPATQSLFFSSFAGDNACRMSRSSRYLILVALLALASGAVMLHARIPQDPAYHNFADQRTVWGIPNALNVLSNIPFVFVGLWGFAVASRGSGDMFIERRERWAYLFLFVGVTLTCFGSGYYHWNPNNDTLVWDRIPMAIGFAGLLAATLSERTPVSVGTRALLPLAIFGVGSVWYWHVTERAGAGDLRPYALVQFGSLLAVLLCVVLLAPRYTCSKLLASTIVFYGIAKLLESTDGAVYRRLHFVSGHSLKHLAAAVALVPIVYMLQRRRPIELASKQQALSVTR